MKTLYVGRNKSVLSAASIVLISTVLLCQQASAAIALDRTRIIFSGTAKSTTTTISNQNKTLPYLAQAWIEDATGTKIESPLTALPPLQRVEPGAKGQVKVQATGNTAQLPQDRETLFYFNLREIPPKASTPNSLQIALQTRIKMFYRPASLAIKEGESKVYQQDLTLTRQGSHYVINNPTGYFVTIAKASTAPGGKEIANFKAVMVEPKGSATLPGDASALGSHPALTFINDWGGRPTLIFNCAGSTCNVASVKVG